MSEMVHITINKQPLEVPAGTRIIEAAKMLNIDIPHLCYHCLLYTSPSPRD